jgi:hypothetical protein
MYFRTCLVDFKSRFPITLCPDHFPSKKAAPVTPQPCNGTMNRLGSTVILQNHISNHIHVPCILKRARQESKKVDLHSGILYMKAGNLFVIREGRNQWANMDDTQLGAR